MSRWLCAALVLSTAIGGCGQISQGDADAGPAIDGGGGGPRQCEGSVPVADFASCYHDAACSIVERCFGDFGGLSCAAIRFSGIIDDLQENVGAAFFGDAVRAQTLNYDGGAAAALMASYASASCSAVYDGSDPLTKAAVIAGGVALGAACFSDLECATPLGWCRREPACDARGAVCCPGVCAAPSALGSACASSRECGASATEPGFCVDQVCRSGTLGAQCNGAGDCASDHYCSGGVCALDAASGGSCNTNAECPSPQRCVGTTMVPAAGRCALVQVVGEACDRVSGCNEGLYCLQPVPTGPGSCQLMPTLGESCLDSGTCGAFLHCDGATSACVDQGAPGDPCGPGEPPCRLSTFCTSELTGQPAGACTAPLADGQVCLRAAHCEGGICDGGRCASYASCFAN